MPQHFLFTKIAINPSSTYTALAYIVVSCKNNSLQLQRHMLCTIKMNKHSFENTEYSKEVAKKKLNMCVYTINVKHLLQPTPLVEIKKICCIFTQQASKFQ